MKSIIYTLISLTILTSLIFPQEKDSLIQLYPGLGDTLDSFDSKYFELFPNIEGFEYAVFYIRDNKHLVSKVTHSTAGFLRDTIIVQTLSALLNSRTWIEQIEKQSNKKIKSLIETKVITKSSDEYEGKFEMFSKDYLYLLVKNNFKENEQNEYRYKIAISEVDSLILVGESKVLSSMGWAALIGLGLGGVIGLALGDDDRGWVQFSAGEKAGFLGGFFGLIGGILGLIAGLDSSTDDEIIQNNSQEELTILKDYVKYYFRYDEELEEKYIEIE